MAVALGGGLMATLHNIRHAQGPRERAFAIRVSIFVWIFVLGLLAALYLTHGNHRYYVLAGCFLVSPILLYKLSTTQQLIRMLDAREREETPPR